MRAGRLIARASPTLFPFLSVLVCMIGAMMLIALAVAPMSLGSAAGNVELFLNVGAEQKLRPVFLGCRGDTAESGDRLHVFDASYELHHALRGKRWSGTPFTDFLNELPSRGEYVVFLVRPSGTHCYGVLRQVLFARNQEKCSHTVYVSDMPDTAEMNRLPRSLTTMLDYDRESGRVTHIGEMSTGNHDRLRAAFRRESDRSKIDQLSQSCQSTAALWVDFGSEMVPEGWRLTIGGGGR